MSQNPPLPSVSAIRRPREIQLNDRYRSPRPGAGYAGAQAATVFLVHDGQGEMLQYRKLAGLLGAEVRVFGLYPVAANGIVLAHTRIDDIAAAYVERVRLIQPQGPYLFGGLCAGGVLAHSMACQLQRAGETIGMLALIDAGDVGVRKRLGRSLQLQIKQFSGEIARAPSPSRAGPATRVLGLLWRKIEKRLKRTRASLKSSVLRYSLDHGLSPPGFVRDLSVEQIYSYAAARHVAEVFQGDVLLFRATVSNGDPGDEPLVSLYADPLLGWERKVQGTVHCVDVAGGHYSMLEEPNVQVIADHIRARIATVRS